MKLTSVLCLLFTIAPALAADDEVGNFDPMEFQPLAVGNSWIYEWSCAIRDEMAAEETLDENSLMVHSARLVVFAGKGVVVRHGFGHPPVDHTETYRITGKKEGAFSFRITASDDVSTSYCRDGRYDKGRENGNSWSWWSEEKGDKKTIGFTETLQHNWEQPLIEWFLGAAGATPPQDEYPISEGDVLQVALEADGTWGETWFSSHPMYTPFVYKYMNGDMIRVETPAGIFDAVDMVQEVHRKADENSPVEWTTHTLFARGVGMVREYQELPDGRVTYDMRLKEVSLK